MELSRPFHVSCHGAPDAPRPATDTVLCEGVVVRPLQTPLELLPLAVSFEQAVDSLQRLPRMFVEPDGSFVWRADQPVAWQLDGNLYDRANRLSHVELKGVCLPAPLDALLEALGHRQVPLVFQLMQSGVHLDEVGFRHWLGW